VEETHSTVQRESDAVCFSAGVTGVAFGAGVIHAYLASDRQPPKVIAGISLGALTAAMERCYHSMGASPSEAARWKWFRRRDVFYGDGGLFDNLPFIPAMQILRDVRQKKLDSALGEGNWREKLLRHHRSPDLFLVGALDVKQQPDSQQTYDALTDIWNRAGSLGDNEKIMASSTPPARKQQTRYASEALPVLQKREDCHAS
jgi:predicted acylesterase/phospholipase RssA